MLPEWKDKKVPDIAKYYWKMHKASHPHHHALLSRIRDVQTDEHEIVS